MFSVACVKLLTDRGTVTKYKKVLVVLNPVSGRQSGGSQKKEIQVGLRDVQYEIREWQGGEGPGEWAASAAEEAST